MFDRGSPHFRGEADDGNHSVIMGVLTKSVFGKYNVCFAASVALAYV